MNDKIIGLIKFLSVVLAVVLVLLFGDNYSESNSQTTEGILTSKKCSHGEVTLDDKYNFDISISVCHKLVEGGTIGVTYNSKTLTIKSVEYLNNK